MSDDHKHNISGTRGSDGNPLYHRSDDGDWSDRRQTVYEGTSNGPKIRDDVVYDKTSDSLRKK